jgi:hypothetical protein
MFVMHAFRQRAGGPQSMSELDKSSKGYRVQLSSKIDESAGKQSLSMCWLGYGDSDVRFVLR